MSGDSRSGLTCFGVAVSLLAILAAALAACLPARTPLPPEPTATVEATLTPTATPVWFPPTATPTPFPTQEVSATLPVQITGGDVILSDDFSDPSLWLLGQTRTTSIAINAKALTLALDQPGGYLYTLRQEPVLSDFQVEVTTRTSLCRGEDEYGLLLRFTPAMEFYRFSLSCNGQARLDKYTQGRASSPAPWTPSGAVPPGAPASARLSAWLKGKEMRFYVNDELQFTVNDPTLSAGSLGFFIRSAGDTAVTVSFSEMVVRQIAP
ncbi:MAG: hypothetical protein L0Z70_05790 [Chloroflexi bacterium]|nr:hypothetical protein [Chloroflexota bacterium]